MSADKLPIEVLLMIFQHLKGAEATACRAVCHRWRDAVDVDSLWKRYCRRDFPGPRAAHRVSGLPYRELYKSLALWDKVEETEVTVKPLTDQCIAQFVILDNNVVAVIQYEDDPNPNHIEEYTMIHYYDIKTIKLISREYFGGLKFQSFDENDKVIVLRTSEEELWVVTKSNKKQFFVDHKYMTHFMLLHSELYFINEQDYLCVAQLKVVDDEEKIETEKLRELHDDVIAYAHAGKNAVNILTENRIILCFRNKNLKVSIQIGLEASSVVNELRKFSFDWSDRLVYQWLLQFAREEVKLQEGEATVIHCHNHIVLVGTSSGTVGIFKQPYGNNGGLKLNKAEPNKAIDTFMYNNTFCLDIRQLGVVEILNGHRLIALGSKRLFFIDLLHNKH